MKSYKFGPYEYRMEYQGKAYRVDWAVAPQKGDKAREPFSHKPMTIDGIDGAGMILATAPDGYQSASAPWDLDFVEATT